jgi:hypothetical protein
MQVPPVNCSSSFQNLFVEAGIWFINQLVTYPAVGKTPLTNALIVKSPLTAMSSSPNFWWLLLPNLAYRIFCKTSKKNLQKN